MKLIIFDINKDIIDACQNIFKNTNIECIVERVENIKADYVVTAGNSHGIMSGGIDLAVRNWLGLQIEMTVQDEIKYSFNGFLPVGRFIVVPFRQIHANEDPNTVPHLIYAPTMEEPGTKIYPEDVYYVASKIFRFMLDKDKTLAICGLGTLTGGISPNDFAIMIYKAYTDITASLEVQEWNF